MMPSKPNLHYRPDVDGLRAVAVLAVLAFHAGGFPTPGGFVGVDVFFVISGYLISSLIMKQIAAGTFSITSFYERRIRRILPALTVMLAFTCVLAYLYLLPTELKNFADSLLAANFSASNFYFWQHSDYFVSPLSNPLLHTWSLAVEEQFYIVFPLLLYVLYRWWPGRVKIVVAVLAALSLAVSGYGAYHDSVTTFYMLPTRAWELLIGTLLAMKLLPELRTSIGRNLASITGILLIGCAILLFTKATPFPGLAALPPCVGAALIIWSGESGMSVVNSALSLRPVVFIGLISYSLYLFHWPIIVFQKMGAFLGDFPPEARL